MARQANWQASSSTSSPWGTNAATCRLCWEPEGDAPDGMLLSPCVCRGSCAFIHRGCLQRWLETRPRGACDICRSPYDAPLLADVGITLPPPQPDDGAAYAAPRGPAAAARRHWLQQVLDPHYRYWRLAGDAFGGAGGARRRRRPAPWWRRDPGGDPRFWAGLLHGGWRALVAADGCMATLALARRRRSPSGLGWPWRRGGGGGPSAAAACFMGMAGRVEDEEYGPEVVRASFEGTTMWQVQLYSAIIALAPSRTACEACSGMALGAIIGGCLSSVAFLPLVGMPRLDALVGAARLAAAAALRLAAGLACRPAAHRRLVGALSRVGRPLAWAGARLGRLVRGAGPTGRGADARSGRRRPPQ